MGSARGWKASIQKGGNGVYISQVRHLGLDRETFDSLGIRVAYISQLKAPWFVACYLVAQVVKNLPAVQETWVRSLSQEDPWRREATQSSILAWRIPWTEEPGGLQSMELQSQTPLSD